MTKALIVIAGPAGGGKSTKARELAEGLPDHFVVHTDDFVDVPWEEVPGEVRKIIEATDRPVILEGVRALSCVYHNNWLDIVKAVWWCDRGPGREGCEGLETRQRRLLSEMGLRSKVQRPSKREDA